MELPKTNLHAIQLNPSCSGQAHSNRPGTGPEYENYNTPCCIYSLSTQKRRCQVQQGCLKDSMQLPLNGFLDFSLSWQASEDPLKDHTKYDQGPEIHSKPRRVLLPVGKAQLAGCLRVLVNGPLEWDTGIQ